jgi:hypothetical protein
VVLLICREVFRVAFAVTWICVLDKLYLCMLVNAVYLALVLIIRRIDWRLCLFWSDCVCSQNIWSIDLF